MGGCLGDCLDGAMMHSSDVKNRSQQSNFTGPVEIFERKMCQASQEVVSCTPQYQGKKG